MYNPADMISSTHQVTFVPNSKFTLEESRKQAEERKKSRNLAETCPETMAELAKHSGYSREDLEGGYGAWSRKRLNDEKVSSTGRRRNRLN